MRKGFSLIETIFSLVIISILIGVFFNIFQYQNSYDMYNELQNAENSFHTNKSLNIYSSDTLILERKVVP